ncbi:MAG: TIGR03759 family integrating conjugative element protein [Gammaproteobacteria bacterium]
MTTPSTRAMWISRFAPVALSLIATAVLAEIESDDNDVTESRATWSRVEQTDPKVMDAWTLTETETARVDALLQGVRGTVSDPRISPIEVLGIHARSDAERRRYAKQWARLQIADAERILAFERAYRVAVRELLQKRQLIDRALLAPKRPTATLESSDRLLLFTRADCAACEALQARVMKHAGSLSGIDIYLLDETRADAIRAWAREQGIDPARVRAKEVTLNADNGLLERLAERTIEPPYLLRQRGDRLKPIVLLDGR